ncbi:MAG TPA: aminopeptidase [Solirubrobacterales bacterium]|nr:aminopeptidase [Solirubrobacterales bacterium]
MSDLERAIDTVIEDCMGVREGENVLVVCNPATLGLGERLRGAAGRAGADAMLAMMAERATHGTEPPAAIAAALKEADVALIPTVQSLSHTAARREACEAGARIGTLPHVTEDILGRVMLADMAELKRRGRAVAQILTEADEVRITCPNGTDLRMSLAGRIAISDDGDLTAPGAFGNLPCGEGFISPRHDEGEGTLVVDGTHGSLGLPSEPTRMVVENGALVEAPGEHGARFLELLRSAGEGGTFLAELGIGTNECATLTGNLIEDEKILGTCHVAFGASAGIGGEIQVPIHEDVVVMKPTVEADGEPIIRDGQLQV